MNEDQTYQEHLDQFVPGNKQHNGVHYYSSWLIPMLSTSSFDQDCTIRRSHQIIKLASCTPRTANAHGVNALDVNLWKCGRGVNSFTALCGCRGKRQTPSEYSYEP